MVLYWQSQYAIPLLTTKSFSYVVVPVTFRFVFISDFFFVYVPPDIDTSFDNGFGFQSSCTVEPFECNKQSNGLHALMSSRQNKIMYKKNSNTNNSKREREKKRNDHCKEIFKQCKRINNYFNNLPLLDHYVLPIVDVFFFLFFSFFLYDFWLDLNLSIPYGKSIGGNIY